MLIFNKLKDVMNSQRSLAEKIEKTSEKKGNNIILDKALIHGEEGFNSGYDFGYNIGTIETILGLASLGANLGSILRPASALTATLAGAGIGAVVGMVEERYLGLGSKISGILFALFGGVAGFVSGLVHKD